MAKKVYHIPLQQALDFTKTNKSTLTKLTNNPKNLEYSKLLGRSYYTLEIEKFIRFFKIDKDVNYALSSIEYFHSNIFLVDVSKLLNFSQFELKDKQKDFFYAFCLLFSQQNQEAFSLFTHNLFLHFHTTFNSHSNIEIDYQEMSHTLLKSQNKTYKDSFGQEKESAFFKIFVDDIISIEEKGKRIKTLRKKAYKRLFFTLIE
jgi:hypothetical protein